MSNEVMKHINAKIQEALTGCFDDSMVYGVGFIKVELDEKRNLTVEHVPFTTLDEVLERVKEHKKHIV